MRPTGLITAALCLAVTPLAMIPSLSANAGEARAEILDYGIYETVAPRIKRQDANTTAGYRSSLKQNSDLALVKQTHDIPLSKGVVFGYRVRLHGISNAEVVPLEVHYQHPPLRRHDGQLTTGFVLRNRHPVSVDGILETGVLYRLSEDYEMVPGEWTFALVQQGKRLVTKTFKVRQ